MTVQDHEIIRVAARQTLGDGQDHVNVYFFEAQLTASQADQDVIDTVVEEIDNAHGALNAVVSNTMTKQDMKIDIVQFVGGKLATIRSLGQVLWTGATYVPGGTGDVLPPGVAALAKFLTGYGKVYARKFLGGLVEGRQNGGILDSTGVTAVANFASTLLTPAVISAGNELAYGVMSKFFGAFVPIDEVVAESNLAYQRRRRRGTGS
jgi:hypothetical protein